MVFNATFDNIWWWALLVEKTGENHRPVASHRQTLSHNVVHLALIEIRTHNITREVYVIWMWIEWYRKYQPAEPEYEVCWRVSESQSSYSVEQADMFPYQSYSHSDDMFIILKSNINTDTSIFVFSLEKITWFKIFKRRFPKTVLHK
jgi:hypothetical protein